MGTPSTRAGRAALALACAATLAIAGAAADARGPAVAVSPATGGTRSAFRVAFTLPTAAGIRRTVRIAYEISALGPVHTGCAWQPAAEVRRARAGHRVRVRLVAPRRHVLCRGVYRGTVAERRAPFCRPGVACPGFSPSTRVVARFGFRVR